MSTLREFRLKSGIKPCEFAACASQKCNLESLEERQALSTVTQTITILGAQGQRLSNASVAITDTVSTKAPKPTNSQGIVSFTVESGIRSIMVSKTGYVTKILPLNFSAANYNVTMQPLPTTSYVKTVTSMAASTVWALAKSYATPVLIKQTTVQTIADTLGVTAVSVGAACAAVAVLPSPFTTPTAGSCAVIAGSTAGAVATYKQVHDYGVNYLGWREDRVVNIYWSKVLQQFFIVPVN
jgi:hypothetical protein